MANLCKITVVKCSLQEDLIQEYHCHAPVAPCPMFQEGQVFYGTTTKLPEGFCAWAYADIARDLALTAYDEKMLTTKITCCTSGFHNVYFKIEAVEKENSIEN